MAKKKSQHKKKGSSKWSLSRELVRKLEAQEREEGRDANPPAA
jgi:hypothetical protein